MKTKTKTKQPHRIRTVSVYDRHGIERVWAICSSRCVGCCFHGLHHGTIHVCANRYNCQHKEND